MKTIWKYELSIGPTLLDVPKDASLLTVQIQNEKPCLWMGVDPDAECVRRTFHVIGTGHPIVDLYNTLKYVGTFQLHSGTFVGHVFEEVALEPY